MSKTKLILSGMITDKKIVYLTEKWADKFKRFKDDNEGSEIDVTFEKVDTPLHYVYKYYWGYLLPDITKAAGEISQQRYHLELKKEFMYIKIDNDIEKIKNKHKSRCTIYIKETVDENTGELKPYIDGYTPSLGDVTHEEALDYIKNVENRLFIDIQGAISIDHQDQAKIYRDKGFGKSTLLSEGQETTFEDDIIYGESF